MARFPWHAPSTARRFSRTHASLQRYHGGVFRRRSARRRQHCWNGLGDGRQLLLVRRLGLPRVGRNDARRRARLGRAGIWPSRLGATTHNTRSQAVVAYDFYAPLPNKGSQRATPLPTPTETVTLSGQPFDFGQTREHGSVRCSPWQRE
jgi:hypothetical protein